MACHCCRSRHRPCNASVCNVVLPSKSTTEVVIARGNTKPASTDWRLAGPLAVILRCIASVQLVRAFPSSHAYAEWRGLIGLEETTTPLLLVDDDPELLQFLMDELKSSGHICMGVNCGQEALLLLRHRKFSLVLLDWGLPDFDGVEICRRLRSSGNTTPVLMITAHDALEERVTALDAGADDYITKPFELDELHARVRAQLRRRRYEVSTSETQRLSLGDLQIDLIRRHVQRAERTIQLSQREFDLLAYLVQHANTVMPRQTILGAVWGTPFVGDPNTLDVYMGYLRRKIEASGLARLLHTSRGVGYMARVGELKP